MIASKLGAMAEIVEDGVTGLHFEAGNANDLANKVHCLQSQPELCKRMGQQARQVYLDKYTPEKNYQHLITIYQTALNG
ncbi:Glycosyl transferase, group 1 domain protein [Candidatus Thiomargarita nelsonii]|uniref:Glycosyl transferase, group 1 domain protein n=1 Tax=Candidatus Thiomargarita nelsonii TaxID=1003181 RepID=A0A176S2F1_9GAMM|nr:Glycosyl transferase, group 1 domain protein [Candidatus Thiomargarita nelsonii]